MQRRVFWMAGLGAAAVTLMLLGWSWRKSSAAFAIDEALRSQAKIAEARVREHQQEAGYWLTPHTPTPRFEKPVREMNTFLTALLIDLLSPLGKKLDDSVVRARKHLSAQIEPTGLVRYHGLPDGPWIGKLGCVISPDADDTALVWRVAPGPDLALRAAALTTIEQYRTEDGLYRTWLAPVAEYMGIDPGRDPNPADIGIQMNLLMTLAEAKPPAAHALCEVLRGAIDQDRIRVYYEKGPLVPMLRVADLRRLGCNLTLPESRTQLSDPAQAKWMSVARLLGSASPDAAQVAAALREIAADDFALIRQNPPLLYHNDLSARVRISYWSEDVGYALWLRLYDELERGHG